jgi:GT2 family glycosyltransferase
VAVTAIIVTYHTGPRLKQCLYALLSDPQIRAAIIVDNGNPEAMTRWLDQFCIKYDTFQLIRSRENLGFGTAVNRGFTAAKTEHVLVINPDAILRWNSVQPMLDTASTAREPYIIGGRIFDMKGREERGARRKELTLFRAMTRLIGWNTWTLEHTPPPETAIQIPVISGALFLMSAAGFARLGGFDEDYFLHVEDIDLCRRAREAGGEVWYNPTAAALHFGATSNAPSKTVARHKADSLTRYFRKFAKGPFHRVMIEIALPFIRVATVLKAR